MRSIVLVVSFLFILPAFASTPWLEQRADLEFARDQFLPKSLAFAKSDRRRATAMIDQVIAHNRALSSEAFLLATLQVAVLSGNAHEGVHGGWLPSTRLPLRMIWFPDAMVIARAAPQYAELLGARVEAIEGMKPRALQARLRTYAGGTDDHLRWSGLWLVELGGMLHAMGVAKSPDRIRMRLRKSDGKVVDVAIPFVSRSEAAAGASPPRFWSASPYESEAKHGWRSAIDGPAQPLYLRDEDEPFRIVQLLTLDALYVQFRANSTADAGGRDIVAFVTRVREEIAASRPAYLVLDLRFDMGGDIDQTRELARFMARSAPGRVFVLSGPYTFSAGIVMAAAVKHDARERAVIVGEPAGDRLRFWSEGRARLHAQLEVLPARLERVVGPHARMREGARVLWRPARCARGLAHAGHPGTPHFQGLAIGAGSRDGSGGRGDHGGSRPRCDAKIADTDESSYHSKPSTLLTVPGSTRPVRARLPR